MGRRSTVMWISNPGRKKSTREGGERITSLRTRGKFIYMENDDLAKKLEKICLPEIELQSHKTKLRLLLMEKYSPEKKRREIFGILNKLVPATTFAVILFFIFFYKINLPTDNLARAREIALQNIE